MEATRVFILAIAPIEIFDDEEFFAHDEVVTNKHARDGAKKTGVADEPNKNVIGVVRHQLPWLHDDAHGAGDETAGAETDAARGEIEKSLAGETTLAATLTLRVAMSKAIMARTTAKGLPRRARTATGFQSASPNMISVAEVTAMPMK